MVCGKLQHGGGQLGGHPHGCWHELGGRDQPPSLRQQGYPAPLQAPLRRQVRKSEGKRSLFFHGDGEVSCVGPGVHLCLCTGVCLHTCACGMCARVSVCASNFTCACLCVVGVCSCECVYQCAGYVCVCEIRALAPHTPGCGRGPTAGPGGLLPAGLSWGPPGLREASSCPQGPHHPLHA